jgi:hypothetical protein
VYLYEADCTFFASATNNLDHPDLYDQAVLDGVILKSQHSQPNPGEVHGIFAANRNREHDNAPAANPFRQAPMS